MAPPDGDQGSQVSNVNTAAAVKSSYANASISAPTNEQAVVIESLENTTIDEYLDAFETLIEINSILGISKITGDRVIVFLNSRTLAEELNNKKISIGGKLVTIRPYHDLNKRVVISNVSLVIPNSIILDALKKKGITPVSKIQCLRASLSKPGRSHILSFRRQFYINEDDLSSLPPSFQIVYEGISHWIYTSTEAAICYSCKQSGHIAKLCPTEFPETLKTVSTRTPTLTNTPSIPDIESNKTVGIVAGGSEEHENIEYYSKALKRFPPPRSTSSEESALNVQIHKNVVVKNVPAPQIITEKDLNFKKINNKSKRLKKSNSFSDVNSLESDLDNKLSSVKALMTNSDTSSSCNYEHFKYLLESPKALSDPIAVTTTFTDNLRDVISSIDTAYNHIEDSVLKSRCTRIRKKLLAHLEEKHAMETQVLNSATNISDSHSNTDAYLKVSSLP